MRTQKLFKITCIANSLLFTYLFIQLLFFTNSFIIDMGLKSCQSTLILGPRISIFMLGIALLMFGSRNLPNSKARQIICLSTGATMLGLACDGSYELIRGTVNFSMLQAIIIESTIGVLFFVIFIISRKEAIN